MTNDVGVTTGDLAIRTTRRADHCVAVTIQCAGVDEWSPRTGSPVPVPGGQLEDYHPRVLDVLEAGAQAVILRRGSP
ncbi:hypothetical protein SXANM310S_03802 [Streptomyces xanthochromogenes]